MPTSQASREPPEFLAAGKWRAIKPPLSSGDVVVPPSSPCRLTPYAQCSHMGLSHAGFRRSSLRRYWKPAIGEESSLFLSHCLAATNASCAPQPSMASCRHHAIFASLCACYSQDVTSAPTMRYLPYRARLGPKSARTSARRPKFSKNIIAMRAKDLCLWQGQKLVERVTKTRSRQVRVGTR